MLLKRLFVVLGICIALLVGAALIVPGMIDWAPHRDAIARQLSQALKRNVTLRGGIDLSILPTPTLVLGDAHIASLPGAADQDLLSLRAAQARVALFPLLSGRIQVESVTLIEPVLALEVLDDGRRTWTLGEGTGDLGDMAGNVQLDDVQVRDGTVIIRDQARGTSMRITNVDASITAGSLLGPFGFQGTLTAGNAPLDVQLTTGRMTDSGVLPAVIVVQPEETDASVRLKGILSTEKELSFQGEASAEGTSAGQFLSSVLGMQLPLETAFHASASINANAEHIAVTHGEVQAGDDRLGLTANITLPTEASSAPHANVQMTMTRLDLDGWLERLRNAPPVTGTSEMPATAPMPSRPWTVDVGAAVDAISYRERVIRETKLEGRYDNGHLTLDRATALLPGSTEFSLGGTIAGGEAGPRLETTLNARTDNLRILLEWLGVDVSRVPASRLRKGSLVGQLEGTWGDLSLKDATAEIDTLTLSGGLRYLAGERVRLELTFQTSRFDLSPYYPADIDTTFPDWGNLPEGLDLRVSGSAETFLWRDQTVRDASADIAFEQGSVILHKISGKGFMGADVQVTGNADSLAPLAGLDVNIEAQAERLGDVLNALKIAGVAFPDKAGTLRAAGRVNGDAERLNIETTLEALDGSLQVGGTLGDLSGTPAFDLKARLTLPDTARVVALFHEVQAPSGAVDLYSEVAGTVDVFTLAAIQGTIADGAVQGDISVDRTGARPTIKATLQAGEVALSPVLAAFGAAEAVPVRLLNDFDGTLALNALAFDLNGMRATEPAMRAVLKDGMFTLEQMDGGYRNGRIGLKATLDVRDASQPSATADLTLSDAVYDKDNALPINGTLGLTFSGTGKGMTWETLRQSFAGRGEYALRDGTVGLSFDKAGKVLTDMDAQTPVQDALQTALVGGENPLRALTGTVVMDASVIRFPDMRLVTPSAEATGEMRLDRLAGGLSGNMSIRWPASTEVPPVKLAVAGTPEAPIYTVDASAIQKSLEAQTPAVPVEEPAPKPVPTPPAQQPQAATPTPVPQAPPPRDVVRGILEGLRQ